MKTHKIQKILVANRGEIACRVMRTAKRLGIQTVAVYSDADRGAKHVEMADEALYIGASPSKDSYLVMDKIIEACLKTQADALHPGYGFLSENPVFVKKLEQAGIIFIGPDAQSMEIMGGKISAKQAVAQYDVPMVPGMETAITDITVAKARAEEIGFPILIKASAGGGGKGMRLVEIVSEFEEQMKLAQSEALTAFGDDSVFIEKFVTKPRHIEIQIMADKHGNVVYLHERECSIQRRHQKLVEEAPSALLNEDMRKRMGESAVYVAKACNYEGAGTVEFLVDDKMNFYFLEMNTRLQVEHPVTEYITGIDLVEEQIRVAEGHPLSFTQDDLKINGHAIELRVCAEDPMNNFLPDIGKIEVYIKPTGAGIRVDDGTDQGREIAMYYDPMIAKLIVHADTRQAAIEKMKWAIDHYHIDGVNTTLAFGKFVMNHPLFIQGDFDTNFIQENFKPEMLAQELTEDEKQVAALFTHKLIQDGFQKNIPLKNPN